MKFWTSDPGDRGVFTQLQPFHRGQYFQLCFAEKPLQSNNTTATCPATACLSLDYGFEISCWASVEVTLFKQVLFLNQASCTTGIPAILEIAQKVFNFSITNEILGFGPTYEMKAI